MKWYRWCIAAALLVPPAVLATAPLAFSASSILVTGSTHLQGDLAIAEAFSPHDQQAMGWTLNLNGSGQIQVESAQVLAVDSLIGYQPQPPAKTSIGAEGLWRGTQWMNDSFVFIRDIEGQAAPSISINVLSTRLDSSEPACRAAPTKYVGQSMPPCRETGAATSAVENRGDIELQVVGPFQVVLWGWTLENKTTTITTGETETTSGPTPIHHINRTTLVATYESGQLTMRMDAQGLRAAFIENAHVMAEGLVVLQDATGQATGDVQLEGTSKLAVQPQGSRLSVSVLEHETVELLPPSQSEPDGTVVNKSGPSWAWLPISVTLAIVGLAAVVVRHRRRPGALARISRALDEGQHDHALQVAQEPGLSPGSAKVLQAIALIKAGRLGDAERLLERSKSSLDPAARHFLLAIVAASRHEDEVARRHLRACFRHDPAYRLEAAMNSHLRRAMDLDMERNQGGREAYT